MNGLGPEWFSGDLYYRHLWGGSYTPQTKAFENILKKLAGKIFLLLALIFPWGPIFKTFGVETF